MYVHVKKSLVKILDRFMCESWIRTHECFECFYPFVTTLFSQTMNFQILMQCAHVLLFPLGMSYAYLSYLHFWCASTWAFEPVFFEKICLVAVIIWSTSNLPTAQGLSSKLGHNTCPFKKTCLAHPSCGQKLGMWDWDSEWTSLARAPFWAYFNMAQVGHIFLELHLGHDSPPQNWPWWSLD